MSLSAMQQLLGRSEARGLDRAIGAAVAYYANPDTGLAWPSNERLMSEWGFSERRIQTALRALEDLGELRRQPALESIERRRVYLIGSGQLSILDGCELGAEVRAPASVRPHHMLAGAPRARVEGTEEPLTATPPGPPWQAGGERTETTEQDQNFTAHSDRMPRLQGAAVARRRRRRRPRAQDGAVPPPPEPCPLDGAAETIARAVEERWRALLRGLEEQLPGEWIGTWLVGAHLHTSTPELELGVSAGSAAWLPSRCGHLFAQITGMPVRFVACERAERQSVTA